MIYLDNAATTTTDIKVADYVYKYMVQDYGNPSSLHQMGLQAEKAVKKSAQIIAKQLSVKPEQLVFTSGGTESNNAAILRLQYLNAKRPLHFITSSAEHPSVLACFEYLQTLGHVVAYLKVDAYGSVSAEAVLTALRKDTALVSVMHINNETGAINPINAIASALQQAGYRGELHVDGTQAIGKIEVNLADLAVDYYSASAHKFHGPKGAGLLFVKRPQIFKATILGGGQQAGLRSGTHNVPAIVGMAVALQMACEKMAEVNQRLLSYKSQLEDYCDREGSSCYCLSPRGDSGAPHIISLAFKQMKAEVLLHALEQAGFIVSSKSACSSSKKSTISHVLTAIGVVAAYREGVIRISPSRQTESGQITALIEALTRIVPQLQQVIGEQHG